MNIFTEHPKSVGESYFKHFFSAMKFSGTFLFLFVIAFVHAILPFLFIRTASDRVCEMTKHMECRKEK